jgi:hypothetical protein
VHCALTIFDVRLAQDTTVTIAEARALVGGRSTERVDQDPGRPPGLGAVGVDCERPVSVYTMH